MTDHGTTPASGDLNQDILGPNYQPPAPKYGSWGSDPRKSQSQGTIPRVDSTDKLGKASKALKNFLSRAAPSTSSKSHNPEADSHFASMLASSTDTSVLAAPEGPKRQAGGATGGRPGTLNLSNSQSNMDELRAQIAKEKAEKERKEREARITATLAATGAKSSTTSSGSGGDDTHGHPPNGEATWPGAGAAGGSFEGVEEILGQLTKVSDRLATAEMQKEDFKTEAAKLAREKGKLEDERRELQFKLADLNSKYETIRNQAGFKNLEAQVLEVRRLSHYTQDLTKDLETAKRQAADAKAQLEKMQSERDQLQKTTKESADRETELQKRVATQTMIAAEMERNMRAAQDKEKEIKEKLQTIQDVHDKAFGQLREEFKTQLEDAVQQKTVVMKQAQSLQKDMNRKAAEAQRLKDELTRKARSLEDALAVLKDYVDADALKNKKRSSEGMAKAYEELKALSVKMTGQIHHKDDEITRLQHEVATQARQIAALEVKLGLKSKHAAPSSGVFDKSKLISEDKDNSTVAQGHSHSRSQSRGGGVLNSPSPNSGNSTSSHHVNGSNSNSASFGSPQTVFSMIGSSGGTTPVPSTTTVVSPTGVNDNPFLDTKQSAGQGGNSKAASAASSRFEEIDPDEESTPPTSFVAQPVIQQPVTVPLTISPPAQATSLVAPGSTPGLRSAGQPSPSLRPAAQPLEVRIVPVQRRKESLDMGFNF